MNGTLRGKNLVCFLVLFLHFTRICTIHFLRNFLEIQTSLGMSRNFLFYSIGSTPYIQETYFFVEELPTQVNKYIVLGYFNIFYRKLI